MESTDMSATARTVLRPLKRINALITAYNAAVEVANAADPSNTLHVSETRDIVAFADAALRDYKSRGHGWTAPRFWRVITGRWNQSRSIYDGHKKTSGQFAAQRSSQAEWNAKVEAENTVAWAAKLARREERRAGL